MMSNYFAKLPADPASRFGEERKIAAQNDMRCQAVHLDGCVLIGKVSDKRLESGLTLRFRALIERRRHFPGL
jgi:hypothetical protein